MKNLWEFKVKYKRNNEVYVREHYFNAKTYEEAEGFHNETISRHGNDCELISVERKCPYSNKWFLKEDDFSLENN